MAQRKLGRGLASLVTLSPAAADGTARISEVTRTAPETSVLSLSGRSVEDFVRVPAPARVDAVRIETVRIVPESPRFEADGPAPDELVDPVVEIAAHVPDEATPARAAVIAAIAASAAAPSAPAAPPPPVAPLPAVDAPDSFVFLDEQVGGIVLPDVELE